MSKTLELILTTGFTAAATGIASSGAILSADAPVLRSIFVLLAAGASIGGMCITGLQARSLIRENEASQIPEDVPKPAEEQNNPAPSESPVIQGDNIINFAERRQSL